ncbi:hypothetical protein Y032_0663g1309 [Ancylostoma ceylanicum]|uniref:Apple domain-containing protein n=1 Tax=Ancylostoma ceylanicum TaxID=53326 RepID=A0A016WHK9_9BILA|nr:hypothetical protein Y032_0663g1309 [Ancylostoma ceylanicum]
MADDLCVVLALLWISGIVDSLHTSFVVESSNVVGGSVLSQFSVDSLRECSTRCLSEDDCGGFIYLIKSDDKAHCLLIDVNKSGIQTELPVPEAVLYSGMKIHLNEACSLRTFAFERLVHLKTISKELVLHSENVRSLEECLVKCQERSDCRAAQFNRHNSSCDLLRASPSTVYNVKNHFAYSDNRDIYENNCLEGE